MNRSLFLLTAAFTLSWGAVRADEGAGKGTIIAPLPADEVRTQILEWAASSGLSKEKIDAVAGVWLLGQEPPSAQELHARTIETFQLVSPEARNLILACKYGTLSPPDAEILSDGKLDPFFAANLRAHLARFLGQNEFYDEALVQFDRIDLSQAVDPASCLFFKAVCQHSLLMKKDGLETIGRLLNDTTDVPVRYRTLAELMQTDLAALKEKSLNEVSRMMSDVERRLRFGRGGERVQKVEEEIVATLDEIIKKIEEQQGGGGGGGGGDGQNNSNSSGGPANDSSVKGATAPGDVDERDIGRKSGWGSLPPKEQAKARNLIDRELPPHYRAAIEEYLRKIARRPANGN